MVGTGGYAVIIEHICVLQIAATKVDLSSTWLGVGYFGLETYQFQDFQVDYLFDRIGFFKILHVLGN